MSKWYHFLDTTFFSKSLREVMMSNYKVTVSQNRNSNYSYSFVITCCRISQSIMHASQDCCKTKRTSKNKLKQSNLDSSCPSITHFCCSGTVFQCFAKYTILPASIRPKPKNLLTDKLALFKTQSPLSSGTSPGAGLALLAITCCTSRHVKDGLKPKHHARYITDMQKHLMTSIPQVLFCLDKKFGLQFWDAQQQHVGLSAVRSEVKFRQRTTTLLIQKKNFSCNQCCLPCKINDELKLNLTRIICEGCQRILQNLNATYYCKKAAWNQFPNLG